MSNCGNGWNEGLDQGRKDAKKGDFQLDDTLKHVTLQPHNHFLNGYIAGYRLGFAETLLAGKCPVHFHLEDIITSGGRFKKCD